MARLRLRYEDTIVETEKATLFLIRGGEYWLPKWSYRFLYGSSYILIDEKILKEKDLLAFAKTYRHVPELMEVEHGQQAIDELRFDPDERG